MSVSANRNRFRNGPATILQLLCIAAGAYKLMGTAATILQLAGTAAGGPTDEAHLICSSCAQVPVRRMSRIWAAPEVPQYGKSSACRLSSMVYEHACTAAAVRAYLRACGQSCTLASHLIVGDTPFPKVLDLVLDRWQHFHIQHTPGSCGYTPRHRALKSWGDTNTPTLRQRITRHRTTRSWFADFADE